MKNFLQTTFDDEDSISLLRMNFADLDIQWRLVDVIYWCAIKWGDGVHFESVFFAMQETIFAFLLNCEIFYHSVKELKNEEERKIGLERSRDMIFDGIRAEIIHLLSQEMMTLCKILANGPLQISFASVMELEGALIKLDWIFPIWLSAAPNSTSHYGACMFDNLMESMRFLKNFIHFVKVGGLEHTHMRDLLIHVQGLVFEVASYIFKQFLSFNRTNDDDSDYNQLTERIEPTRSHVCEIYVGVLKEVSKLLRSSTHPQESHPLLLVDFVDSLLFLFSKLLFRSTTFMHIFCQQKLKLHEGLRFLRCYLKEHHDKVDQIHEEMHKNVVFLICEAGIVIFSLFLKKVDEGGLVEKFELVLLELDKTIELIKAAEEKAGRLPQILAPYVPQTELLGFIDSVLEKRNSINLYKIDLVVTEENDMFQSFLDALEFVRSFLVDVIMRRDQIGKFQAFWSCIAAVAYEIEFVLDSMDIGRALWSFVVPLNNIIEEIKIIKTKASEISLNKGKIFEVQNRNTSDKSKILSLDKNYEFDELVVGLDDEAQTIIDLLTRGSKNLDVVSIVGMAGLGKTTLAKKVYRHHFILDYFDACSWCTISQVYNKISVLLEILKCLDIDIAKELSELSANDLADKLRKFLKGKRYLIVLDDVWDIEVWNNLKPSFPNDIKGSRILLTSRYDHVALQTKHHLRNLTNDECWTLFRNKICLSEDCPEDLLVRGKAIAQRCYGLPLMILIVVGILSDMEPDSWKEVEESLNRGNISITNQWIETLELSYRHLPEYLKPCFLYFSAFGEDQQIPIRQLVWLWIAEGFVVKKNGRELLENVAEGYLRELIKRNLVMIAKKGSAGRVKSCVLHDLLHNFSFVKAKEEYFLHCLHSHDLGISNELSMIYRLSVYYRRVDDFEDSRLIFPRLRTLLLNADFVGGWHDARHYKFFHSKLLRVLELTIVRELHVFPGVILQLLHLKYLALRSFSTQFIIPPSFANLSNLETFIFYGLRGVYLEIELPNTLWNMTKLKNLYTRYAQWVLPSENPEHFSNLEYLQNLSSVTFSSLQTMMAVIRNFTNIRKLKCDLNLDKERHVNFKIVSLDFLSKLESLKFYSVPLDCQLQFPRKLKRLSLLGLMLPWNKITTIYCLTNLEVLKLQSHSFTGDKWDMPEGEEIFPNLRFLKLEELDLCMWMASDDNFPCLEKLVLSWCDRLVELPTCLAESSTLEMIEVCHCPVATNSLIQIHEMKEKCGNEHLNILSIE